MFWKIFLLCSGIVYAAGSLEASAATPGRDFVEVFLKEEAKTEHSADEFSSKAVRIYYRVNRTEIDSNYMGNSNTLSLIDDLFTNALLEEGDFIVITGSASPEGGFNNNQRLAIERALALKDYIKQKYPEIRDNQFVMLPDAEDWAGLKEMVENDENVPARDQLLEILTSNLSSEKQKEKIKKVDGGKSYKYLLTYILPYLRGSATGAIYSKKENRISAELPRVDTVFIDREILRIDTVCPEKIQKPKKPFVIAVKNNLIYDAALLPNLAIEIPFGHNYNWSANIKGNWSWWNTNADSYHFHRVQIAEIELRHWFENKTGNPLNGWYFGAYAYGGTYDLRLFTNKNSDEGQLSNWTYSGGFTFGYAMPIAERFNLEFGLGIGYLGGKYHKYTIGTCEECIFPWKSTRQRHYIGPTQASISLVWLIGNVTNKNKGKENQR